MKQKQVRVKYDLQINSLWRKTWTEQEGPDSSTCYHSLSATRWQSAKTRSGENFQIDHPSYAGVTHRFPDFQRFVEWSRAEYGYDLDTGGWCLDKDILVPGNLEYSEDYCIYVPQEVNKFFCGGGGEKNPYPAQYVEDVPHVGYSNTRRCFIVRCGKDGALGKQYFTDPYSAHRWWQGQKIDAARRLQAKYHKHTKLSDAFDARIQKCADDLSNGRTTPRF